MLHVNFDAITHKQLSTLYLCSMGGGGDYPLVPRIKSHKINFGVNVACELSNHTLLYKLKRILCNYT